MSVILSYEREITHLQLLDGRIEFTRPLDLSIARVKFLRLVQCTFTSNLPNVYAIGKDANQPVSETNPVAWHNGLLRISKDGGETWFDVFLHDGVYDIKFINSAILNVMATWWIDSNDPGFNLAFNLATNEVYFSLDSTKLADEDGQLAIDFIGADDSIGELLGFRSPHLFDEDGLHEADSMARIDWFGSGVSLQLEGLGSLSIRNGNRSNELARIPLAIGQVTNEYIYPSGPSGGNAMPRVLLEGAPNPIHYIDLKFRGDRVQKDGTQRPVYARDGHVSIILELSWN